MPPKKKWCHHPLKRPVRSGFSRKGGGSGSSFAKLCCRCFEWGFRVCTEFSGYVVVCPFLSGPDVLVLPEKDEAVLQKDDGLFLKDHGLFQKDAGPFKKGPDVFYRCRNPLPFPFFPFSPPVYAPVCAPARPRVNIIMCVHFPSSGVRLKNMSYNISLYQPVTNKF